MGQLRQLVAGEVQLGQGRGAAQAVREGGRGRNEEVAAAGGEKGGG